MGSFFTNIHVRTNSRDAVVSQLPALIKEPAKVSESINGWVSVFPKETEKQKDEPPQAIAKGLSASLYTEALAFLMHDSDVFMRWKFEWGHKTEEYNSNPKYFDQDPDTQEEVIALMARVVTAQRGGASKEDVTKMMADFARAKIESTRASLGTIPPHMPIFADDLVVEYAKERGINPELASVGFKYVQNGDLEGNNVSFVEVTPH